ncbi:MAG TPA: PIN domain-containing protein [Thermoplasmata archaeon]|nr:PIN domain-containing protein [Thermoplasmata archaeon]
MSGPIVLLDTNIFVSARNRRESGHETCRRLLDRIDEGKIRAQISTVSIAEIRAGLLPAEARTMWQAFVSHLLTSPYYRVEPVDVAIAEMAGQLRSDTKLSLPDALIVATGHLKGAGFLVTQDRQLSRLETVVEVRTPQQMV